MIEYLPRLINGGIWVVYLMVSITYHSLIMINENQHFIWSTWTHAWHIQQYTCMWYFGIRHRSSLSHQFCKWWWLFVICCIVNLQSYQILMHNLMCLDDNRHCIIHNSSDIVGFQYGTCLAMWRGRFIIYYKLTEHTLNNKGRLVDCISSISQFVSSKIGQRKTNQYYN